LLSLSLIKEKNGLSLFVWFQGLLYTGNDTLFESTGIRGKVMFFIFFSTVAFFVCLFLTFSFLRMECNRKLCAFLNLNFFSWHQLHQLVHFVQRTIMRFSWALILVIKDCYVVAWWSWVTIIEEIISLLMRLDLANLVHRRAYSGRSLLHWASVMIIIFSWELWSTTYSTNTGHKAYTVTKLMLEYLSLSCRIDL
jgi:hypothetical protein